MVKISTCKIILKHTLWSAGYHLHVINVEAKMNAYLIDVCILSPGKVTFFDWVSPPVTSCKYSATTDRAAVSNLRASSSHTQQCTPRRPENTHSKCSNPKSSGGKTFMCIKATKWQQKAKDMQLDPTQLYTRLEVLIVLFRIQPSGT